MREDENQLVQLRAALRQEPGAATVDAAAAPLIARHFTDLLRFADRLAQSSRRRLVVEGADLAADAWLTALRRLTDDAGSGLTDENHFRLLLFRIVRTRFLDALEREQTRDDIELDVAYAVRESGESALGESLLADERAEGDLFFGESGRFLPLVSAAFQGDEAFKNLSSQPPRRRARQYQALILFHLGEFFRREIGSGYGEQATLFRNYIELLEIPRETWNEVEDAALCDESEVTLIATVNRLCETNIKDRTTLSVLRYELNQLV
jgi:DNA-directed RNA polymerase specialized sigma24 family protein